MESEVRHYLQRGKVSIDSVIQSTDNKGEAQYGVSIAHSGYSDTLMNSWVLDLPDREYASTWTVLVGDLETCTVMSRIR